MTDERMSDKEFDFHFPKDFYDFIPHLESRRNPGKYNCLLDQAKLARGEVKRLDQEITTLKEQGTSFIRGYEKGIKMSPNEDEWRDLEAENAALKKEIVQLKGAPKTLAECQTLFRPTQTIKKKEMTDKRMSDSTIRGLHYWLVNNTESEFMRQAIEKSDALEDEHLRARREAKRMRDLSKRTWEMYMNLKAENDKLKARLAKWEK